LHDRRRASDGGRARVAGSPIATCRRLSSRGYFGSAPKASRRPSQSFTTNSRESQGVLSRPRVNATPQAPYSAKSASASSTNRYASRRLVGVLVRIRRRRFGAAEVNPLLIPRDNRVDRRVLPGAQTIEAKFCLLLLVTTFPMSGRVVTILGGVGRGSGQTRPIIAFRGSITPTGAAPRPECSPQRERGGSARPRRPGTTSAGGSSR
jgi:hypothetical protein